MCVFGDGNFLSRRVLSGMLRGLWEGAMNGLFREDFQGAVERLVRGL